MCGVVVMRTCQDCNAELKRVWRNQCQDCYQQEVAAMCRGRVVGFEELKAWVLTGRDEWIRVGRPIPGKPGTAEAPGFPVSEPLPYAVGFSGLPAKEPASNWVNPLTGE